MKTKSLFRQFFPAVLLLGLSAAITGCGDNGVTNPAAGNDNASVSFMSGSGSFDNVIEISEAKALVNEVEIESEPSGQEHNIRIDPFVVYFTLNGSVITVTTGMLPEGTFNKVKFKLHKPEDNENPPDPEFKEGTSGNLRYSFIIKGSFNGSSFVYKSRKSVNLVILFNSIINFQSGNINITIVVDPSSWFKSGNEYVDPRDPANENLIDENIKNSFKRAFRDDDKNGIPDN